MAHCQGNGDERHVLSCPICLELFVDPVLVHCERNFCRSCIACYRQSQQGSLCCPECALDTLDLSLQSNRILKNVTELVRRLVGLEEEEGERENVCDHHGEKLSLVCETDGMLVCPVCRDSKFHKHHKFRQRSEFIVRCRAQGAALLKSLNQKVKALNPVLRNQELEVAGTKEMGCDLICHIAEQFADLHQFLHEAEQQLTRTLEFQVEINLAAMDRNLTGMRASLHSMEQDVTSIENKLQQSDMTSLQEITCWRHRFPGKIPKVISRNICLGTFKGPLQYKLWREMQSFIRPAPAALTLDPQTANPWLLLSEDLASVMVTEDKLLVPDDPARFDICVSVLAAEGFVDGTHYWEVEVAGKSKWYVGVARESINRKGDITLKPENGYLTLSLSNGNEYCALTSPNPIPLPIMKQPDRIGVYLDYKGGQVSFYDAGDLSHLYTFTETFTEKIFPFFCPCLNDTGDNSAPLSIRVFH
ncbi:zinc-binding protein A33-like [Amblyraja radiata]|uniref:zinc-binding protein A33-like n=1 Tax=Amblyraja radiata TaxID=386614 RepID=UPI0014024A81|nr:zinc-binding protein A33-like [Amblyraja radiata]